MQPILHEYLVAIESRIADTQTLFQVAMVELNMSPMLEARYRPVTPPDFRIFYKANNIKYVGALDIDNISDWVLRKIGLPNNRISSQQEIRKKL
jgi:hypothetical protein